MNERDLQIVLKKMREPRVALPMYKKYLRAQLLMAHQQNVRHPFSTFLKGVFTMKKQILTIGLPVALVAAFAFLGLTFINPQPATAQQLVESASKATVQMSPEKLQEFNEKYKQDLQNRLNEARADSDLKVMAEADLESWGFVKKPDVKTSLGYIDKQGHRIVIGLGDNQEPIFVYDVDVDGKTSQGTSIQDANQAAGSPANLK